jgi:hypothetical protein
VKEAPDMIQDYLVGELSVHLAELQEATPQWAAARDVTRLRHQVESGPLSGLATATMRAMAMADGLCWDSLEHGDTAAFARQARVCAKLRQFGVCAHLLADN